MSRPDARRTFLLLTQVFVPDPASSGQHAADSAAELVRRGHRVVVFTARRGYDDSSRVYPARENVRGVEVVRFPLSSFGKASGALRALAWALFLGQCAVRGLFVGKVDCVIAMTSPPLSAVVARALGRLRGASVKCWVMDLWVDLLEERGTLPGSAASRALAALERWGLGGAADVVVLDRFMAERVRARDIPGRIHVLPPWPHEDELEPVEHAANPFRMRHALDETFVFMLSGNLSVANPVTTILEAALRVRDDPRLRFLFVGSGHGRREIEAAIRRDPSARLTLLPYQPLSELRYSLSAADVHLVSLGNDAVGIVHPCKVYGAMAVARPVLYLGPEPSHIADIVERFRIGWRIAHGDVEGAVRALRAIAATPPEELRAMGQRARLAVREELGKGRLCGALCDVLELASE